MSGPETAPDFVARLGSLVGQLLASDELVHQVLGGFAHTLASMEADVHGVIRSRYIDLADSGAQQPADLVRIASLVGLSVSDEVDVEQLRERLRLFIRAYLQGAGTPRALLTMAAAQLNVVLNEAAERVDNVWLQTVHRLDTAPAVLRLEENPLYRVERQPVMAKTGTRWTIENPGILHEGLLRPEITVEALVEDVHGPSLVLQDIGVAWLSPGISLERGDRLVLGADNNGEFRATLHDSVGVHDVTDVMQLIGSMPDVSQLALGLSLRGGSESQPATLLLRSVDGARIVRFCAQSEGIWGNGLSLRMDESEKLRVSYDPNRAVTGQASTSGTPVTEWVVDVPGDVLSSCLDVFSRGTFLVEADDATIFLPVGRSNWIYFDHLGVRNSDVDDLEYLARLLLGYTRFDHTAYHDTDTFDVHRFDREESIFGLANYTTEEEQVRITVAWREPRPTAIRLEVPPWLVQDSEPQVVSRRYELLGEGIKRIKPAGVSASIVRDLPPETLQVQETVELERIAHFEEQAWIEARFSPASRVVRLPDEHVIVATSTETRRATRFVEHVQLGSRTSTEIAMEEHTQTLVRTAGVAEIEDAVTTAERVTLDAEATIDVTADAAASARVDTEHSVTMHTAVASEASTHVAIATSVALAGVEVTLDIEPTSHVDVGVVVTDEQEASIGVRVGTSVEMSTVAHTDADVDLDVEIELPEEEIPISAREEMEQVAAAAEVHGGTPLRDARDPDDSDGPGEA